MLIPEDRGHGIEEKEKKEIDCDENVAGYVTIYNILFTDYPLFMPGQAILGEDN